MNRKKLYFPNRDNGSETMKHQLVSGNSNSISTFDNTQNVPNDIRNCDGDIIKINDRSVYFLKCIQKCTTFVNHFVNCVYFNNSPQCFLSIEPKIMYNSNSLPFILFLSHHSTRSDISHTMTVTFLDFPQHPNNHNVIPTTSQCHSHLTENVLPKYIPNTSTLPNDNVYNDIILRLNSYPIIHSYCKKRISVI